MSDSVRIEKQWNIEAHRSYDYEVDGYVDFYTVQGAKTLNYPPTYRNCKPGQGTVVRQKFGNDYAVMYLDKFFGRTSRFKVVRVLRSDLGVVKMPLVEAEELILKNGHVIFNQVDELVKQARKIHPKYE